MKTISLLHPFSAKAIGLKEKDLYLRQRINSIKIEKDLLKLLYNENIKYDCARVSMLNNQNQFGGAYNLEYKIGKYALKFKNNINNKTIKNTEFVRKYDIKNNEIVYKRYVIYRDKDSKDLINAKVYQTFHELKHSK